MRRMDDMTVVDPVQSDAVAAAAQAGMGDDGGGAEIGLDPVVVDVDPQALADQPRGGAVEGVVCGRGRGATLPTSS